MIMYLFIPKIGNEKAPKIVSRLRGFNITVILSKHTFFDSSRFTRFNEITHYLYKGLFKKILIASEWH